jgi:butyryl-CoA dehydrogenase
MDVSLSPAQRMVRERYAELISDDLVPSIRRTGEVPRHGGDAREVAEVRAAVWHALVDLGATRLLLPEHFGGERLGQQGAVILAELLGSALYQGPLLDTMTAAELLLRVGGDPDGKLIGQIAEGAAVVLAPREHATDGHTRPGPFTLTAPADGATQAAVTARRRFVAFAADAQYLLVLGTDPARSAQGSSAPASGPVSLSALVRRDDATVSLRRHEDVARGELYDVRLDRTPAITLHEDASVLGDAWPRLLAQARIRHAAYLVGLCQGALDLAVHRARERRQFGQPIGRFQAPAFALAEIATRLEATRWFVYAAAWEADTEADARLSAAQALAMAADLARAATSAAMQIHGAYGTTEQADVQLYYRRASVDRVWFGSPAELRTEVLPLLLAARRQDPRRRADPPEAVLP